MPNQTVQEKAVDSNSVFTCVPKGEGANTVKEIQWFDPSGKLVPSEADRIYSELHASFNLLLIIKKTERSDAGVYKCIATTQDDNKLTTEFTLKPYVDITWVDVPLVQHPIAEMDGLIKCEVNADPPATINWAKNGHNLKPDDRCKHESNGIRCFPILESDKGVYSCRAVVSSTGRVDEKVISVEVYVKPVIEGAQEIYEAIEDNALTLTCNARGNPLPTYTWLDKNNNSLKDKPGYLVNVTDGTGTLKINRVTREDSGKITCVAKNIAGEDSAVMKVQVIVKPKIVKFVGKTVAEGDGVNLQCYVQAEPPPTVVFYHVGTGQPFAVDTDHDNMRIRVFSGTEKDSEIPSDAVQLYTLEINNVERKDDGEYQCIAKNTGGSVKATSHLQVEYVPVFINKTNEVLSWINNPVNLTCRSSAIPNATLTWSSEGNIDLKDDANIKFDENLGTSILTVLPIDKDYFGRYQCTAKNRMGETSHWITLKQAFIPDEIMQVIFLHKTATTATISLRGPKMDGGMPVEKFAVDYWRQGEKETDARRRIWSISPTYILEKLDPNTEYHFRFAAINEVGTGPWTKEEIHKLPKKAAPEEPRVLKADSGCATIPYSNMYNLEWEVPQDNGEKIKHFQISYFPVNKVGSEYLQIGERETREIPHPGKTQYTIDNLESVCQVLYASKLLMITQYSHN
ncbi:3-oxoacyl-[acyl-carrier-protein] synthase [Chamberlinius hualienensis]